MKYTQKTLLIVTLLASYSTAQAQGMIFTEVDTDGNGVVSEQEFNTARADNRAARAQQGRQMRGMGSAPAFAAIDVNNDGYLTPDEMQRMQAMQQSRRNRGMGPGSRAMGRPPQPVFTDFDINKDGGISEQEFIEARGQRVSDRAREGRPMRGLANMAAFVDIDINRDGNVTEEEFTSFRSKHMRQGHGNQPRMN